MAQIIVRNLDDSLVQRIKALAVEHGHSMEAEVRAVLEQKFSSHHEAFWEKAQVLCEETRNYGSETGADIIRSFRDTRNTDDH